MSSIHSNNHGTADIVIGLQHGDEGKGRFVDGLAESYDWIARYNGGANAGHTVMYNGVTLKLHQLPSGVQHPKAGLFIGAHCVVNAEKLMEEIREVEKHGLNVRNRLRISPYAGLVQPSHILLDAATMGAIGTTKNGIGPAYAARCLRKEGDRQLDLRAAHLVEDMQGTLQAVRINLIAEAEKLNMGKDVDIHALMETFERSAHEIARFVEHDVEMLIKQWRRGKRILLEGAQAFGLDVTYGATPDVTASNTGAQAALVSVALPAESMGRTIGVAKAIPSRVGHGPFPTEFGGGRSEEYCEDSKTHSEAWERETYESRVRELLASDDELEMGIAIRMLGGEYGATTGRPRRVGALDLMHLKHAVALNGIKEVFLTKVDQLSHFSATRNGGIPLTNAYERDGRAVQYMPATNAGQYAVTPKIHYADSFTEDLSSVRSQEQLPEQVSKLLHDITQRINARVTKIGVGPSREQMVDISY